MPPGWYLTDVGDLVTLPIAPRWSSEDVGQQNSRILNETTGGVRYGYHFFKREVRQFTFRIPESMIPNFKAIHEATFGEVIPFYFVPDVNASPMETLFVRKEKDFLPVKVGPGRWTSDLEGIYDYTLQLTAEVEDQPLQD